MTPSHPTRRLPLSSRAARLAFSLLCATALLSACDGCEQAVGGEDVLAPVVDDFFSPTNARSVTLTGTKQASTSLSAGGTEVVALDEATTWSATFDLEEGENVFRLACHDRAGTKSPDTLVSVVADFTPPNPPVLDPEPPAFSEEATLQVTGTKDVASGVWVNGEQMTGVDDELTFSGTFTLEQGENTLRFTAQDAAGNESDVVAYTIVHSDVYFTVDTLPELTAQAQLTVGGAVGEGVAVYLDGSALSPPAAQDGTWSATIDLDEGENTLVFEGRKEGSLPLEISRSVTLDSTPPAPPRLDAIPALTASSNILISGEKDAGASVIIDGVVVVDVSDETTFENVNVQLELGLNVFDVRSADALDNTSAAVDPAPTVIYDPSGVQITVDPVPAEVVDAELSLTGTRGESVDVYIDGELADAADGSTTWTATVTLDAGDNTVVVLGRVGGTSSTPLNVEVRYNADGPSAPGVSLPTLTSNPNIVVNGTKDRGTAIAVDGNVVLTANDDNSFFFALNLVEGEQTLQFTAIDSFGRISPPTEATITLDTVGPMIELIAPVDGDLVNETMGVLGVASDANGVAEVRVQVGDAAEVTLTGTTNFDEVISTSGVAAGEVVDVVVTAQDGAGAESTATVEVFVVNDVVAVSGGADFDQTSQNADISADDDGFWAVFEDASVENDEDIYLARYDGETFVRDGASVLVSDNNDDFASSLAPKVAADGLGGAHIIFQDDANSVGGNSSLVYRHFDGVDLDVFSPSSVIADGNNGAVLFSDVDSRGGHTVAVFTQNGSVWVSSLTAGTWSVPVDVTDAGAVSPAAPRVQVGADGIAHVVWVDSTSLDGTADDGDIVYRRYDVLGLSLSDPVLMSSNDINFVDGTSNLPDIALVPGDPNHLAYVTWLESGPIDGAGNNQYKVAMRSVDDAAFDAMFPVTGVVLNMSGVTGTAGAFATSVAANDAGDVSVVWVDVGNIANSGADADVFLRHYNGGMAQDAVAISDRGEDAVSTGMSSFPRVAAQGDNVHVVWTEASDVAGSIDGVLDQDVVYFGVTP